MANPLRGEVWLVDLGMVAKIRPCLVLSVPANGPHDRALATVVAHTTAARGSAFEVAVSARFLKKGVFDPQNIVSIYPMPNSFAVSACSRPISWIMLRLLSAGGLVCSGAKQQALLSEGRLEKGGPLSDACRAAVFPQRLIRGNTAGSRMEWTERSMSSCGQ